MDDLAPLTADPPAELTAHFVHLSVLTDLARLGASMRRAQQKFFEARRTSSPGPARQEAYREARALEAQFDAAVADALARERIALPGMEGGVS